MKFLLKFAGQRALNWLDKKVEAVGTARGRGPGTPEWDEYRQAMDDFKETLFGKKARK